MHRTRSNATMDLALMVPDVTVFSTVRMHQTNRVAFVHLTNSGAIMANVLMNIQGAIMLLTARMGQTSTTVVGFQ